MKEREGKGKGRREGKKMMLGRKGTTEDGQNIEIMNSRFFIRIKTPH